MNRSTEIIDLLYTKKLPTDISMFILSLERQDSIIDSYFNRLEFKDVVDFVKGLAKKEMLRGSMPRLKKGWFHPLLGKTPNLKNQKQIA